MDTLGIFVVVVVVVVSVSDVNVFTCGIIFHLFIKMFSANVMVLIVVVVVAVVVAVIVVVVVVVVGAIESKYNDSQRFIIS